jgi:hypothetical protein
VTERSHDDALTDSALRCRWPPAAGTIVTSRVH